MSDINIILADDHSLFRRGMRKLIDDMPGMKVTHEAADGEELMQLLSRQEQQTDVILMDLNMPRLNGIDATGMIRERYPAIKIIVLTVYDDEQFIVRMVEKGADGYLFKNADIEEVTKAITDVMANGFYFSNKMLTAVRKGSLVKTKNFSFNGVVDLTTREVEILRLICAEFTAAEIAEKLFISMRTVNGHRQHLLDKTGARNTAGLVIYAVKKGLLDIGF